MVKYREHSRDVSWDSLAGEERSPQFWEEKCMGTADDSTGREGGGEKEEEGKLHNFFHPHHPATYLRVEHISN